MYPIAGIAGGLLATLGILSLAVSGPASLNLVSSALTSPVANTADQLDRTRKGDRLAKPPNGQEPANVTVVTKGLVLPEVTVREKAENVPKKVPVKTLQEDDKQKRLVGCDPLVSPLAGSSLSQIAGRCIAGIPTGEKLAMR